jgi:hypothetical protein
MNKNTGSGYLITALGGGVALVCLALGFQLLSPDLPGPAATWMEDDRIRNGLVLALGGALLSFLLGSGFVLAARRCLPSPRRRKGADGRPPWGNSASGGLVAIGDQLGLAGKELATLAANPQPGPDSLERLNQTMVQLRETVQQTEAIISSINDISDFPALRDPEME